jgi:hypothetical protein
MIVHNCHLGRPEGVEVGIAPEEVVGKDEEVVEKEELGSGQLQGTKSSSLRQALTCTVHASWAFRSHP